MYQTGTATSATDLLTQLATFLTSAGWTINKNQAQGSGWWISVQKGSDLFANLVSDPAAGTSNSPGPFIYLYGATGFNSGSAYNAQPGTSGQSITNKLTAPFTKYYFFEGDDYCHIVIEVSTGRYRHIHIGTVEKCCTLTGGHYFMGQNLWYASNQASNPITGSNKYPWEMVATTNPSFNYVYANAGDGAKWFSNYSSDTQGARMGSGVIDANTSATAGIHQRGLSSQLYARTPNVSNGISPLTPMFLQLEKVSGLWCVVGQPKDLRYVSLANYAGADTITIGSDEWLIFPFSLRSETVNDATTDKSGYYGYAYRKNTA